MDCLHAESRGHRKGQPPTLASSPGLRNMAAADHAWRVSTSSKAHPNGKMP